MLIKFVEFQILARLRFYLRNHRLKSKNNIQILIYSTSNPQMLGFEASNSNQSITMIENIINLNSDCILIVKRSCH